MRIARPWSLDARPLRHALTALALLVLFVGPAPAAEDVWTDLKGDIFGDRPIQDGTARLKLEAPYRAHDAALVPIKIEALKPERPGDAIKAITLVIDKNPAPVAAVFELGPLSGIASLSTRVRVNAYSHVRAIAETRDGRLLMVSRFVKASGGCAAPANKDADKALSEMGRMKLRQFTPKPAAALGAGQLNEAQLMIRHPNNSGLQMNQLTGYYIPAHFVRKIDIHQGDDLILSIEGAISLSEDPTVRFHYLRRGKAKLRARVEDTEENVFSGSWPVKTIKREGS